MTKEVKQEQGEPVATDWERIALKGTRMKHKHADLIHAWADGAEIQYRPVPEYGEWKDEPRHLIWDNLAEYRIKPEQDGSLINEGTKTKQGKPVSKFAKFTDGIWREVTDGSVGVPLYTHPKEWVGLTDDQMSAIAEWQLSAQRPLIEVIKAVEQALKEKNT